MTWVLNPDLIQNLIITQEENGKYIVCNKYFPKKRVANPEEIVRQILLVKLILHYNYDPKCIITEHPIQIGATNKRADIVILKKGRPYIICETKAKEQSTAQQQLSSYLAVTRADFGIVASGTKICFYKQNLDGSLSIINDIPISYSNIYGVKIQPNETADVETFGVTKIIKYSGADSGLIINTQEIRVKNDQVLKYQKIQKLALQKGIMLSHSPSTQQWHIALRFLFDNAETMPDPLISRTGFSKEIQESVKEFVTSKDWVTTSEVISEVLQINPKNVSHGDRVMVIDIIKSLGWVRKSKWIKGKGSRYVYVRP